MSQIPSESPKIINCLPWNFNIGNIHTNKKFSSEEIYQKVENIKNTESSSDECQNLPKVTDLFYKSMEESEVIPEEAKDRKYLIVKFENHDIVVITTTMINVKCFSNEEFERIYNFFCKLLPEQVLEKQYRKIALKFDIHKELNFTILEKEISKSIIKVNLDYYSVRGHSLRTLRSDKHSDFCFFIRDKTCYKIDEGDDTNREINSEDVLIVENIVTVLFMEFSCVETLKHYYSLLRPIVESCVIKE